MSTKRKHEREGPYSPSTDDRSDQGDDSEGMAQSGLDFDADDDGYADDFDFDDDADGEELLYDELPAARRTRQSELQVEFQVRTREYLVEYQDRQIGNVGATFGLPAPYIALLLQQFKWKTDTLVDRYLADPDATLRAAGVVLPVRAASPQLAKSLAAASLQSPGATQLPLSPSSPERGDGDVMPRVVRQRGFSCAICTDSGDMDTFALNCGHSFCKTCYSRYVSEKIRDEGRWERIACPMGSSACAAVVDAHSVEQLVSQQVLERYRRYALAGFVDSIDWLRWCPAAQCDRAIECHVLKRDCMVQTPVVKCACGTSFCFTCGESDHRPCICPIVRLWLRKCADESETANYISANTKECPKCGANIEKNGGCNHMTCRKCAYQFCWVCLGDWNAHGNQFYQCNRYDAEGSREARQRQDDSREALNRYLFHFRRYQNHRESAKGAQEYYKRTEHKMEELQRQSDMSWIEVQYMGSAVQVEVEARIVLMWTYSFAYYLESEKLNNYTKMFQDNQRDLETAVETLSELLEKPIATDRGEAIRQKQEILDKEHYVAKRREVLLHDTYRGFSEDRWRYIVDIRAP